MPDQPKPTPASAPRTAAKSAPAKPTAAAKPGGGALVATEATPAEPVSRLSWILGWIVAPGSVVGAIYGGGVLLGAHYPDGWFARSVMWVTGLF